jgi:hypothetical protein
MRARRVDLGAPGTLVVAGTALALLSYLLPTGIRWLLVPLALVLPGHAFICAVFGDRLEFSGVRRVSLAVLLSLVTYPILALAVSGTTLRMTQATVAASTWLFVAGCAAVVGVRARRSSADHIGAEPEHPAPPIDWRQLVVPGVAMAAALLIAWAGVQFLPRKPVDEFSVAAFDGSWSLVDAVVPVDPGLDPVVSAVVENRTTTTQSYRVTSGLVDGPEWTSTTRVLEPGQDWRLQVTGAVPAGECRAKLEIRVRPSDGPALDPLTVYFRDRDADCSPSAAGN